MCISAAIGWAAANAGTIGAVAGGIGAASSIVNANKARADARHAASEMAQAEARSVQSANARLGARRRALKANSLLASDEQANSGMAATQRATLGGE